MGGNRILPNENQTAAGTLKTMWLPLDLFLLRDIYVTGKGMAHQSFQC